MVTREHNVHTDHLDTPPVLRSQVSRGGVYICGWLNALRLADTFLSSFPTISRRLRLRHPPFPPDRVYETSSGLSALDSEILAKVCSIVIPDDFKPDRAIN